MHIHPLNIIQMLYSVIRNKLDKYWFIHPIDIPKGWYCYTWIRTPKKYNDGKIKLCPYYKPMFKFRGIEITGCYYKHYVTTFDPAFQDQCKICEENEE